MEIMLAICPLFPILLDPNPLLGSHGKKGQNILKEFDHHYDEARYVGDC